MTAGRLVSEAVGNAAPGATNGTFAVALVGETGVGWFVDAASAGQAIDVVLGALPRAREVWRRELLVRTEDDHHRRCLPGAPFAAGWTRLWPRRSRATYGCAW